MRSVALTRELDHALREHLVRDDRQEDLCFAVWFPSRGAVRFTALLQAAVLPNQGDRLVHGNVEFYPQYLERALSAAIAAGGGLAFLHSHPSAGWQRMSPDDVTAERSIAPAIGAATGLPLVGLTLGAVDGRWSARFWNRTGPHQYEAEWVESIRIVGDTLRVSFNETIHPRPKFLPYQVRTVSAWGEDRQGVLSRLKVGVVGLGSVGAVVAEALMRTGVHRIDLFDFDVIKEHNLDRLLCTGRDAIGRSKVAFVTERLRKTAPSNKSTITPYTWSICEEAGYRRALDCDILFSCVDRPWPRSVLNFIAYAHLIPVIDGGISVSRRTTNEYRGADWRAHATGPERRCLRCLHQFDPGLVATEREGTFDDPRYLESLPGDHPIRSSENVFAFSVAVASLEILQLIMLTVPPTGLGVRGAQMYHLATGKIDVDYDSCDDDCDYPPLIARGDTAGNGGVGRHLVAENERARYALSTIEGSATGGWFGRILRRWRDNRRR